MTNNRDKQLGKVKEWATGNNNIRAMLLTSSLSNPDAPVDVFSDLDIEFVVSDLETMLSDDAWIANFGNIVSVIVENEAAFDGKHAMRMVFYEDYSKIDFKLYALDKFLEEVEEEELQEDWDVGYRVLLDKDGITAGMKPPTYKSVLISKPTEETYRLKLNDYWWEMTYIAKCLRRDELFFAKFVSEQVMRFENLQLIIEWYIGMQHDWKITTNKRGRLFKQYLDPEIWKKAEATFSGSDIEDNWRALFAYAELGRELGQAIASKLNYTYPAKLDEQISAYILWAKNLKKL
jgi:aminoglycoside 6-adenylyltransferase